jgi:hypothetical protein
MKQGLESFLRRHFVRLHGEGEPHQADVYRCQVCGSLVTHKKIAVADICCSGRVVPANPTWFEKFRLLALPWSI